MGRNCPRVIVQGAICIGSNCLGGNCLGVVAAGGLFRINCPEDNCRGRGFHGSNYPGGQLSRGKCPDTINHNAVFFNYYMSYLPPFPT